MSQEYMTTYTAGTTKASWTSAAQTESSAEVPGALSCRARTHQVGLRKLSILELSLASPRSRPTAPLPTETRHSVTTGEARPKWYDRRPRLIFSQYYANNYVLSYRSHHALLNKLSLSRFSSQESPTRSRFTISELWNMSGLPSPTKPSKPCTAVRSPRQKQVLKSQQDLVPKIATKDFAGKFKERKAHDNKMLRALGNTNRVLRALRQPVVQYHESSATAAARGTVS